MLESITEELTKAEKLIYEAKFEEASNIIENFEKKENITPKDLVLILNLKGTIYTLNAEFDNCAKVGRRAYRLAQKHDMVLESIRSLLFSANILFLGKVDKALKLLLECENLIDSFEDNTSLNILKQKGYLFLLKSWYYQFMNDFDSALEYAEKSLILRKKSGTKLEIAYNYLLFGQIYWNHGELDSALNYAIKSLDIMNELDFHRGIATCSRLVGTVYTDKGELTQALKFLKQSLSFKEIVIRDKIDSIVRIGAVHYLKGEIDKSLKCNEQAKALAEQYNLFDLVALSLNGIGNMYRAKGEYDQAIESFELSLKISEKVGWDISTSLTMLILIYLAKGSREQAQKYFIRLENYSNQVQTKFIKRFYQVTKAMMLKTSGRTRNRAEAEELLRNIIEDAEDVEFQHMKLITSDLKMFSFINLFDLYFGDLYLSNNLDILEDINPLIEQMLDFAKEQHSHFYLAEIKLLQAKIALI